MAYHLFAQHICSSNESKRETLDYELLREALIDITLRQHRNRQRCHLMKYRNIESIYQSEVVFCRF